MDFLKWWILKERLEYRDVSKDLEEWIQIYTEKEMRKLPTSEWCFGHWVTAVEQIGKGSWLFEACILMERDGWSTGNHIVHQTLPACCGEQTKRDDTEFCGVIQYNILNSVSRNACENYHESKDLKQMTDSSKYLKSILAWAMPDENSVRWEMGLHLPGVATG